MPTVNVYRVGITSSTSITHRLYMKITEQCAKWEMNKKKWQEAEYVKSFWSPVLMKTNAYDSSSSESTTYLATFTGTRFVHNIFSLLIFTQFFWDLIWITCSSIKAWQWTQHKLPNQFAADDFWLSSLLMNVEPFTGLYNVWTAISKYIIKPK